MPGEFDRSRNYGAPEPPPEGWSFRDAVVAGYRQRSPARRLVRLLLNLVLVVVVTAAIALLLEWSTAKSVVVGLLCVGMQLLGWATAALWSRSAAPHLPDDAAG